MVIVVEAFFRWGESEVDSFLFTEGEVFFERLRVVFEVGGFVKLDRIDENRDRDGAFRTYFLTGRPQKLEVSFMERSHSWNESERLRHFLQQFSYRVDVRASCDHLRECPRGPQKVL